MMLWLNCKCRICGTSWREDLTAASGWRFVLKFFFNPFADVCDHAGTRFRA